MLSNCCCGQPLSPQCDPAVTTNVAKPGKFSSTTCCLCVRWNRGSGTSYTSSGLFTTSSPLDGHTQFYATYGYTGPTGSPAGFYSSISYGDSLGNFWVFYWGPYDTSTTGSIWVDYKPRGGGETICNLTSLNSSSCGSVTFSLEYDSSGCAPLSNLGISNVTFSGGTDYPYCCVNLFTVKGCNGNTVSTPVTINVWTDSGKSSLISTYTQSNGTNVPVATGFGGSVYYEVTCDGFNVYSATANLTCSGGTTVTLTPSSGYTCLTGGTCGGSFPLTVHVTSSFFRSFTMAYASSGSHGAGWYATLSYSYPGLSGCNPETVTITAYLSETFRYTEYWQTDGGGCPNDIGGFTSSLPYSVSVPCTVTQTFTGSTSTSAQLKLYGLTTINVATSP